MKKSFPYYRQLDQMDCGPTCLRMIAKYYGKHYSLEKLREYSYITREGATLNGLSYAAEKIGFRTLGVRLNFKQLDEEAILPCILYWNENHFVVLPPQSYNINKKTDRILVADPAHGMVKTTVETFVKSWFRPGDNNGIALLLEPTPEFFNQEEEAVPEKGYGFLLKYLRPFKRYIAQLFIGLLAGSILALVAPFLTQSLVDYGINQQNVGFIYLILFSQLALFAGTIAIEIIRSWLLLHISSRLNISIISDFLMKLMRLPIRYFDTKVVGDIMQRISDHNYIEEFLTGTSLSTLFSFVNIVIFSIVLGIYSIPILLLFITGSAISVSWIIFFMAKRRDINYARFQRQSENQNNLFEIVTGMQEIKLNDSETSHRWSWERVQAKLFKTNVRSLKITQYQTLGSSFFNQLKNILISFVAAREVLSGNITLGMMLSISYITGLLNAPISQLLNFSQAAQDAKISLERLAEIHNEEDEEKKDEIRPDSELSIEMQHQNGHRNGIVLENVSFQYGSPESPEVLSEINLTIPFGKVTALVGASGSGKTTLMKLLLKYYEPMKGKISLGSIPLKTVSPKWWWQKCGVVMSDGFIFSNTIARNITVQEEVNQTQLLAAAKQANINDFITELPLGFSMKIGNSGIGISSGQRQRILIARAIYKNPRFLFLDEATSTLDANNEKTIVQNLERFYRGRTVVVIAHRLSTIRHADQIAVMENGRIVETGDHDTLLEKRGSYYKLVKNQLESIHA